MGNGEWGIGNRESGIGNRESGIVRVKDGLVRCNDVRADDGHALAGAPLLPVSDHIDASTHQCKKAA
ncbi:hypothetical protein FHT03_003581 [Xanthomonas arboricola]